MSIMSKLSPEAEKRSQEYLRIANIAIRKTREENRRLGLANVGERDGQTILEMPDGTIVLAETTEKPKRDVRSPKAA